MSASSSCASVWPWAEVFRLLAELCAERDRCLTTFLTLRENAKPSNPVNQNTVRLVRVLSSVWEHRSLGVAGMTTMSTKNFFTSASPSAWQTTLRLYGDVMQLKAAKIKKPGGGKELLDLDKWYQEELPKLIQARDPMHITHEEITKLMKWKLTRGKFRPRLYELVQTNEPALVESASRKAFRSLPNLGKAIKELTVLSAVGPATASAVLAAGAPQHAPFMADESMLPIPGLALKYTPAEYAQYSIEISACVKRLNRKDPTAEWTPHKVELCLWTHHMARKLQPSLLEEMEAGEKRKASPEGGDQGGGAAKRSKSASQAK